MSVLFSWRGIEGGCEGWFVNAMIPSLAHECHVFRLMNKTVFTAFTVDFLPFLVEWIEIITVNHCRCPWSTPEPNCPLSGSELRDVHGSRFQCPDSFGHRKSKGCLLVTMPCFSFLNILNTSITTREQTSRLENTSRPTVNVEQERLREFERNELERITKDRQQMNMALWHELRQKWTTKWKRLKENDREYYRTSR